MRNFSWKYFTLTGDVESFMLYKEINQFGSDDSNALAVDQDELAMMELEDTSG
ncbi:YqzL family protein [Paenibacillus sp. FJAT-27812]|uniref:YqzL family protein n=1 Tax=Paenibacillus sp. FJAT-27812 TaxID=1684143 RepID=UPI0009E72C24|nr:YqzL family protein [Paenibacillus sp. FJAT-27812]